MRYVYRPQGGGWGGATGMKQTILDRDQTIAQLIEDMTESQHQYTACYDEVCV